MYIKNVTSIVHFSSKTLGVGSENKPVKSSISDHAIMSNMIKTHQLEHVFLIYRGASPKSVARCVASYNRYFFIINNGTF